MVPHLRSAKHITYFLSRFLNDIVIVSLIGILLNSQMHNLRILKNYHPMGDPMTKGEGKLIDLLSLLFPYIGSLEIHFRCFYGKTGKLKQVLTCSTSQLQIHLCSVFLPSLFTWPSLHFLGCHSPSEVWQLKFLVQALLSTFLFIQVVTLHFFH